MSLLTRLLTRQRAVSNGAYTDHVSYCADGALTVQNFVRRGRYGDRIALVRGFARQEKKAIGNFWVDVTRATVLRPALLYVFANSDQL